jgi:hypothetical protein
MSNTVGALDVEMRLGYAAFQQDLGKARQALDSNTAAMNRTLGELRGGFSMVTRAAGLFGVALGMKELFDFSKRMLDTVGGLGELAEQLGVSTDALQGYQYAATQTGVKAEELQTGLAKLTRTMGEARQGSDEAVKAIRAFGPEVENLVAGGAPAEQVLSAIADALQRTEDPAKRAAMVVDAFGKSGQKLLPFLTQGADGLRQYSEELKRLGLNLSPELIKSADAAADKIAAMEFKAKQLAMTFAGMLAPSIEVVIDRLNELVTAPDTARMNKRLQQLRDDLKDQEKFLSEKGGDNPQRRSLIEQLKRDIAALEKRLGAAKADAALVKSQAEDAERAADFTPGGKLQGDAEKKKAEDEAKKRSEARADAAKREADIMREVDEATNNYLKSIGELGDTIDKEVATPQERYNDAMDRLNRAWLLGVINADTYQRKARELAKQLEEDRQKIENMTEAEREQKEMVEELSAFSERAFDRIGSAITEMFVQGKASAFDWRNVVLGIISELMQEFVKLAILNPLKDAIFPNQDGSKRPGLGGVLGKFDFSTIFGGSSGGSIPNFGAAGLTPGMADGGSARAGTAYRVGEYGAETFVPGGSGTIIPHDAGGARITQVFHFAPGMSAMDRKQAKALAAQARNEAIAAVTDGRLRNALPA